MKISRKSVAVLLAVCLLISVIPMSVSALTKNGSCGTSANWNFDSATGVLNITGTGAVTSNAFNTSANAITSIVVSYGITSLPANCFDECSRVKTVYIPEDVTTIGEDAFYYEMGLTPAFNDGKDDGVAEIGKVYDFVLYGKGGSVAQTYAVNNNIPFDYIANPVTPVAPVVESETDAVITLASVNGYEYSIDGENFQSSPVFTGYASHTDVTFYQRVAAINNVYGPSANSEGLSYKTGRAKPETPATPIVYSMTATTVTLLAEDGFEYSKNAKAVQASSKFTGFTAGSTVTVYRRLYATDEFIASDWVSVTVKLPTDTTVTLPSDPVVTDVTENSITLFHITGYEYSIDGKNFQTSSTFTGLKAGTTYTLYQRIAANGTATASEISAGVKQKTVSAFVLGDVNGDGKLSSLDIIRFRKVRVGSVQLDDITPADIDGNGKLSSLDLVLLKKLIATKK